MVSSPESPAKRDPGLVCTFYSYKGGVGRSMALANVATLMARQRKKVLIIDWDLEAPGLERYFGNYLQGSRRSMDGLIDIAAAFSREERLDWRGCLLRAHIPQGQTIDILHAGREGDTYSERLRAANWEDLFARKFGNFLDQMRTEWITDYDYVLIDSRTGITDIGGICTIFMPDYLISFFTTNAQSVQGVRDTMERAREKQSELPLKRRRMVIIPIAARDESATEYKRAAEWRGRAAAAMEEFYSDWIHKDETAESVLDFLKIPYVAYWSFGEQLPVLEEDPKNPKNLAYSYTLITRLIDTRLDWTEVREGRKTTEQQQQREADVQARLAEAASLRAESQARLQAEEQEELQRRWETLKARYDQLLSTALQHAKTSLVLAMAAGVAALAAVVFLLAGPGWSYLKSQEQILFGGTVGLVAAAACFFGWWHLVANRRVRSFQRERAQYDVRSGWQYADRSSAEALLVFADRIEAIADGSADQATPSGPPLEPASGVPTISVSGTAMALPPPSIASPLPAKNPETTGASDVFFDYADAGIVRDWMREFSPLLLRWLSESLGRDVRAGDSSQMPAGVDWAEWIQTTVARTSLLVVVATPRYLASDDRMEGLSKALRDRPTADRTFIVMLERSVQSQAPKWLHDYQWSDFSDLAYVGEGFSKTERYVEFQDRIRQLATTMADRLQPGVSSPLRK